MARSVSSIPPGKMEKPGLWLILILAVLVAIGLLMAGPIPQDTGYHNFADGRTIWGLPNFWNVVSNIPFLLIGALGLYQLSRSSKLTIDHENRFMYVLFFAGTLLVALGSGYYHFSPSNSTLVWDRLPMTLVLMSLMAIVIAEFVSARLGKLLLVPLIVLGILSILYWHITENMGQGDLRLYVLVQFFPMVAAPVVLVCFRNAFTMTGAYWALLGAYLVAKLFEHFDAEVFSLLAGISGHSIKHLVAALGMYLLLLGYQRRKKNDN